MSWRHSIIIAAVVVAGALALTGCVDNAGSESARQAARSDTDAAAQQLLEYQRNQPVRQHDWSQLRQNLIEIEAAQVAATATTSFFFNQGVEDPVHSCPSIGFPIPSSYQLTNPQQVMTGVHGGDAYSNTIPQIESNGVFTGESTGTYVICVNDVGQPYATYWEGFVSAVTGPARWNQAEGRIELTGAPTAAFSKER